MILTNNIASLRFSDSNQIQILDTFSKFSGKKNITLLENSLITYVLIIDSSDISIDFNLIGTSARLHLYCVVLGNSKAKIVTTLSADKSIVNFSLISFVSENAEMEIDWRIVLSEDFDTMQWYLNEEQFLLGKPKSLLVRPFLDVRACNVKASHGAKIHTLDTQKLFYMMSRGLTFQQSQKMIVCASLQSIFDHISDVDPLQKQQIYDSLISSLFTS